MFQDYGSRPTSRHEILTCNNKVATISIYTNGNNDNLAHECYKHFGSLNLSLILIRKVFCSSIVQCMALKTDMECKYCKKKLHKQRMGAGRAKEAHVQVIKSKNSHLATSETTSQETQFPAERRANFHLNIYLHLGVCRYTLFLSRRGLCEITTAHLHMTPRHSRSFSHFHNKVHLDTITRQYHM